MDKIINCSAKIDYHLKIKGSVNILHENPQLNKTVKSFPIRPFLIPLDLLITP